MVEEYCVRPYLAWQLDRFKAIGGTVIQRKLNSLKEIDGEYDVIVRKCIVRGQGIYFSRLHG